MRKLLAGLLSLLIGLVLVSAFVQAAKPIPDGVEQIADLTLTHTQMTSANQVVLVPAIPGKLLEYVSSQIILHVVTPYGAGSNATITYADAAPNYWQVVYNLGTGFWTSTQNQYFTDHGNPSLWMPLSVAQGKALVLDTFGGFFGGDPGNTATVHLVYRVWSP